MYAIRVNQESAVVEFVLSGLVHMDEISRFTTDLEKATLRLAGRSIKIKADVRALKLESPAVGERIREVQEFGLRKGVRRVAEIVESDTVALQLNRVARESGTDKILRRFWEDESAMDWLLSEDPSTPAPSQRARR